MRLSPAALAALEEGAERAGVTQTQYLERLLVTAAANAGA